MSLTDRAAMQPQDHFELKLPSDPQISPDGNYVAYVRTRADLHSEAWVNELCVVNTRCGVHHELGRGSQPRWSPDGLGLAFVRSSGAGFAIQRWWCEPQHCGLLLTLAEEPSNLAWSPDAMQLAFVKRVPALPPSPAERDVPAWEHLRTPLWGAPAVYTDKLVRRAEGIDDELPDGHHHIFLLTLSDGALRQLTSGPFNHGGPRVNVTKMSLAGRISWLPDGRHIVMSMQRPAAQKGPLDPTATIAADIYQFEAVEAVVARGGVDPKRHYVAGESGGGALTAWLIGHSKRFASAAVVYGVLDWTSEVLTVDRPDCYPYYWLPGAPWEPGMHEAYWRRSPLSLVNQVRTPTLVLGGERDWRTPMSQSEMYYTALKLCGVDAALVRYPDNNDGLEWHPSHWQDLVERVDRWFRQHNGENPA